MGRGSRHSKNAGTMGAETLTYHERRALGFGTIQERLGKESMGNFYDCQLTLQPAKHPVCTPDGVLYSKEAILDHLVHQKKELKRKLAAYEDAMRDEERATQNQVALEARAKLIEFERINQHGASEASAREAGERLLKEAESSREASKFLATGGINIGANRDRLRDMKAFWGNGVEGVVDATRVEKPVVDYTTCPVTGKKLRLKDLVDVHFTRRRSNQDGDDEDKNTDDQDSQSPQFIDPITQDALTNKSRLIVLKPSGDVMMHDTFTKLVKPDGVYKSCKIHDTDVIQLQRGGTGFAAHDKVEGKKHTLLGLNVLRSQTNTSRGGSGLALG